MEMEPLPVDIFQLRRRDPAAWTALLSRSPEAPGAIVTAVTAEPLCSVSLAPPGRATCEHPARLRRYVLTLDGCSDPITFIAKTTNQAEALLYRLYGDPPGTAMPACHFVHLDGDDSWIVLDDVPDHFPPATWIPAHVEAVVVALARVHAARWGLGPDDFCAWGDIEPAIPHFLHRPEGPYRWDDLRRGDPALPDDGPAAIISRHAVRNAGRLAPRFLRAADGLIVMRDLGGWPGVLGRSHLSAAADLLDDPVPMLAPLLDLPATLLHGAPHPGHWRLTLFNETYLIDWSETQVGPGVLDLVAFLEGFPLLIEPDPAGDGPRLRPRDMSPLVEQTIVDTYLLTLAAELGDRFPSRAIRAALSAARCLHVLTTWFPFFAGWAADLPDRYMWQKVNRMDDTEIGNLHHAPSAGMRHYLAGVFDRFLRAYRAI